MGGLLAPEPPAVGPASTCLEDVARALRDGSDPLAAAAALLARAPAGRGVSAVALVLRDPASGRLVPTGSADLPPESQPVLQAALDEGVVDWIVEEGQPRLVPSLADAGRPANLLCLPLVTAGAPLGAIVALTSAAPDDIAPDALARLSRCCDLLAPAIGLSASQNHAATLHSRLQAVSQAARALSSAADLAENLSGVVRLAYGAAPCEGAAIYLPAADGNALECRAFQGPLAPPAACPLGDGLAGWVARHDVPLAVADYPGDSRLIGRDADPPGVRTAIAAPVRFDHGTGTAIPAGLHGSGTAIPAVNHGLEARATSDPRAVPGVLLLVNHRGAQGDPAADHSEFSDRDLAVLMALADQAGVAIERARLYDDLRRSYLITLYALANAIEARDPYTRGHSDRVTGMSLLTARELGWSDRRQAEIEMGGILHDVGKIGIPDAILRKPAPLTDEEFAFIKTHPTVGARILQGIPYLAPALPYVLYHQERYDGTGYPQGLAGDAIPVEGRLLAVADAVDALTSNRPYRQAAPLDKAVEIVRAQSGRQFDPDVVAAFSATYASGRLAAYLASAPGRQMRPDELLNPLLPPNPDRPLTLRASPTSEPQRPKASKA